MSTEQRPYIDVKRPTFRPDHWIAVCSVCTWKSDPKPRKLDAQMEGDEHLEIEHDG
jgi:hypothetical protein